jgi:flagellar hook-basal body complex protein FliE
MDPLSFSRISPPQLIPSPGAASASPAAPAAEAAPPAGPGSFAQLLGEAVARVQQVQGQAELEMQKLLNGEPVELHRVMLASEQAGLASDLLMATRNKVTDAYQEIMRMQL